MPDYGPAHRRLRKALLARYIPGITICWRCQKPITALSTRHVHLGHDDDNPLIWRGLEHDTCNLQAGGIKSGWVNPRTGKLRGQPPRRRRVRQSRAW